MDQQAEFGSAVHAAARTRRVPTWTNMSTYSRLKNTVSTLKKSVATRVSEIVPAPGQRSGAAFKCLGLSSTHFLHPQVAPLPFSFPASL